LSYQDKAQESLRTENVRVAKGLPPPPPGMEQPQDGGGNIDTSGTRNIPKDHKYDPSSLKPLAKMLWAMSVSLGHALQAYRLFNRVKSSTVSPDGMLGGRGYVMKVTDLRQKIYEAVEALSAVSDTIHDELNAPHWKPQIGEMSKEDFAAVERLMGESEDMLDDPEGELDEEEEEVEKKGKPSSSWVKKMKKPTQPASEIPTGGDSSPDRGKKPGESASKARHKLSFTKGAYDRRPFIEVAAEQIVQTVLANSSVNPSTLGGPRVNHLDRGDSDQTGPFGSYNVNEPKDPKDDWSTDEGVSGEPMSQDHGNQPAYQWDGGRSPMQASSNMPTDRTPTEGWDFGIGRGNGDNAHGQGAGGYGTYNDQGDHGVYGPRAELPDDPGGKTHDNEEGDTTKTIEQGLNTVYRAASERLKAIKATFTGPQTPSPHSGLPIEDGPNVARSDYYTGPKDNDTDSIKSPTNNPVMAQSTEPLAESELPNSSPPSMPRPLYDRTLHDGEFLFATTELPGDGTAVHETFDKDLMDTGYRYERKDQPYVKWDDSTHNMRPDWTTQRDDQGPYVSPNK